jgi:hypothetical protein
VISELKKVIETDSGIDRDQRISERVAKGTYPDDSEIQREADPLYFTRASADSVQVRAEYLEEGSPKVQRRIEEASSQAEARFRAGVDGEICIAWPQDACSDGGGLPEGCVATLDEPQAAFAKSEAEASATARKLRLKDVHFEDSKGKHSRYGVRSLGTGKGFGILDKLRNIFLNVAIGSTTRADCYLALLNHDEDMK